jgi:hypothetical protein
MSQEVLSPQPQVQAEILSQQPQFLAPAATVGAVRTSKYPLDLAVNVYHGYPSSMKMFMTSFSSFDALAAKFRRLFCVESV